MSINTTLNYSPNFDRKKRKFKKIKFIIFHYTGMKNEKEAINRLTDIKSKVSSHYFIKNNGDVINLVPELYISWHAGISSWQNYKSLNKSKFIFQHYKAKNYSNNIISDIISINYNVIFNDLVTFDLGLSKEGNHYNDKFYDDYYNLDLNKTIKTPKDFVISLRKLKENNSAKILPCCHSEVDGTDEYSPKMLLI